MAVTNNPAFSGPRLAVSAGQNGVTPLSESDKRAIINSATTQTGTPSGTNLLNQNKMDTGNAFKK
jgi:hypothetical protein